MEPCKCVFANQVDLVFARDDFGRVASYKLSGRGWDMLKGIVGRGRERKEGAGAKNRREEIDG